jgi:putative phosphoribosyl transferase
MIETALYDKLEIVGKYFRLPGELEIPQHSSCLVLFSHGSGSSRLSPRNQYVAKNLRRNGIGTFLFDLLDEEEDSVRARFDIGMLTERLKYVTNWLIDQPYSKELHLGYFGASTGAASALNAAAALGSKINAVVSRGGRPDLAMASLPEVTAATLLIIGSLDTEVIKLNHEAFDQLNHPKEIVVVPGASHLFEETGKLEEVSNLAADWFAKYLK